jgi:hypothetical protein
MKASVLFGAGWENESLDVLWRDAGRAFCRLWRDDADGGRYAFIPTLSGSEHPIRESVNRLTHEFELRKHLDGTLALRPLATAGQTMLVVEYTDGEPLDRLIREPMEIARFLRFAVALSAALRRVHGRGLIHKDLKSGNVLTDPKTGQVLAHRLRHCVAPSPRASIARSSRVHRRNARLHGARADVTSEPFDRFPERSLPTWSHFVRNVGAVALCVVEQKDVAAQRVARQPVAHQSEEAFACRSIRRQDRCAWRVRC